MPVLFLAMVQAISSAPPDSLQLPNPQCEAKQSASEEIVVCARRRDGSSAYRIKPMQAPGSEIKQAEMRLGEAVTASAETERYDVGGFPSNRVMVRLKIKF